MIHKIKGEIIHIGKEEEIGNIEKYVKVDIIVEVEREMELENDKFMLTFFGFEKVQYTRALNIGDKGTFMFTMKVSKSKKNGKYYNGLNYWSHKIKEKGGLPDDGETPLF